MATELAPELEKIIEEQVKEKEKEVYERVVGDMYAEIGRILKVMKGRFGEEAYDALVKANGEHIRQHWREKAENHGDNSIESLIKLLWETLPPKFEWTMEKTDAGVQMKCTKCPIAERALGLGVGEQYYYQSCKGDWSIVEGFNPNIGFTMTKTLMQGDDCCNHFYYYKNI
jgi:predicted ArsR family transcriptional regulator